MGYWDNRNKLIVQANKHTTQMQEQYAQDIALAVKNTTILTGADIGIKVPHNSIAPTIKIVDMTSVDAIFDCVEFDNKAVLNFASYREAGGMFIKGSSAQEESLCHASFLYNVLREYESLYYAENIKTLHGGLYSNRALFSPNIKFFNGNQSTTCSVITCAAPNLNYQRKYFPSDTTDIDNLIALDQRVDFVLQIANKFQVDCLILGAFGCGVFKQNPANVALSFKRHMANLQTCKKVVFAIPASTNHDVFKQMLEPIITN